jgi:hypothetical protein
MIRLFVDYRPRMHPPRKQPWAYRMPGKVLEMAITLPDAVRLFEELGRMADGVSKGKEVAPIELSYDVAIRYVKEW